MQRTDRKESPVSVRMKSIGILRTSFWNESVLSTAAGIDRKYPAAAIFSPSLALEKI
jgi:hypothetical protein